MEITNERINKGFSITLDDTDFRIINLLVLEYDNKKIATTLKIPLSTIQRRTRRILNSSLVNIEYQPNFKVLGIKKGFLHTYLGTGKLKKIAQEISEMEGILSVSVHVGNSDIVSEFIYENSEDLVDVISAVKQIDGVERVLWSEEVFKLPIHKENVMKSFRKYWNNTASYDKIKENEIDDYSKKEHSIKNNARKFT